MYRNSFVIRRSFVVVVVGAIMLNYSRATKCPHAVVAISRHTISCTYYADSSNDAIAQFIQRAMNATNERLEDYNIAMAFRNRDLKAIDHANQVKALAASAKAKC